MSPNRNANADWRKKLPIPTPASPSYSKRNCLVGLGVVHLRYRGPHNGVAGEILADVELGPVQLKVVAGHHRHVSHNEVGRPLSGNRIYRRHCHAIAVGVLNVAPLPGLLGDVGHV